MDFDRLRNRFVSLAATRSLRVPGALLILVILSVSPHGAHGAGPTLSAAAAGEGSEGGGGTEDEIEIGRWYPDLEIGLNFNQGYTTDNWVSGDLSSLTWTALLAFKLQNRLSEKVRWHNAVDLAYGQLHKQRVEASGERVWERPEKSSDVIDFETILQLTLGKALDPYASARFSSQFEDLSDADRRAIYFNPLVVTVAGGVARAFISRETRKLNSRLGLSYRSSSRQFYLSKPPDESKRTDTSTDAGVEWVTNFETLVLNDKVKWTSTLRLFNPFFYSGSEEFDSIDPDSLLAAGIPPNARDFALQTDLEFTNVFTSQITKVLSVSLYTIFVYDKYDNTVPPVPSGDGGISNPEEVRSAIRKQGQFKETIAIGLTLRIL